MTAMLAERSTVRRHPHTWTDTDRDLVRQWYGKVPTTELAERIGASRTAVAQKALKLGVTLHNKAVTHQWTEGEDAILRRDFGQTHASRDRLAERLGLTSGQVSYRVGQLGIAKIIDRRRWTLAEKERLEQLMEQGQTIVRIARAMNRSENAVKLYANRRLAMQFGDRSGWYTKNDVCAILGVDHRWVQARIDSGALPARMHHEGDTPGQAGSHPWHITERDLADFVRTYPQELTGRNVDLVAVISLFAPIQEAPGEHLNIGSITRLQAQGWTQKRIAEHFGVAPATVNYHLKRAGKQRKQQPKLRPTHCGRGHELTGAAVRVSSSNGRWFCRYCDRIRYGRRQGLSSREAVGG